MLSRSDDEFRNFQNYTRLLDCDRNNFIKPNGIEQYENPDPLNAYMIQDPYVMNPDGPAEDYAALNVSNPAELAYGCKLPEGYNSLAVDNLSENFPNKLNWPQGPNPFLMQDDFNQFDYSYNSYLNNFYESQAFERNIEEVPPQTFFENSLAFNPQLNFNNFYTNDPGYYCPNPIEYTQGSFPPNPLINPRSLALATQNPQIPPGVDPIPTTNFNQTLDNIPSSAPIPLSKYSKLSKNSLNSPYVMPPLHGNGMNQHYRLPPNHSSQKLFHYVNGNRISTNIKDMCRKVGSSSALVNDIATTNSLAINDTLVSDSTLSNTRNYTVPSTSAEVTKQIGAKVENNTTKEDKNDNPVKPVIPLKSDTSVTKEDSSTSTSKEISTTLSTTSTSAVINSETEIPKINVDVKVASIKLEEVKKEDSVAVTEPAKVVITAPTTIVTTTVESKVVNVQASITTPTVTTAPTDNLKVIPVTDVSKPIINTSNTSTTNKSQNNNNTVTTANGAVRVRKRHQVKVACVNCRKACKKCDEARPCARCIKMDLCATCVDGERKPREKGVRRGPYKRQKQLQQQQNQNSTNDPKATTSTKANDKDGIQKTRQKKKKAQKQHKQETEADNSTTTNKNNIVNSIQASNPTVTNVLQASINITNPLQVQNTEAQLLQTTLPQDPSAQLTQPTADILNGTPSYNELYGLYGNDNMYLNYYPTDLYYCPNPLNTYPYPMSESYVLPPDKVTSSLDECEPYYKINTESTSSPSATNTKVSTVRGTPGDKLINLSSSTGDVLNAISSTTTMDSTDV